jgi:predicted dehydrogenase
MADKLRFGIIGCGWIANVKHLPTYSGMPDTEIVALCDINRQKAEEAAKRFGLSEAHIYRDYREMLNDGDVEVVHVCTPNPLHAEMTVAAFEAGKHVLAEKPMATSAADARRMINAAKKAGKKLTAGFNWRWRPECVFIKDLCDRGELGDIYFAKAHALRRRGVPTWGAFLDPEKNGGGVLWDGAPHSLDLTLWAMGNHQPKSVKANIYDRLKDQQEGNPWGAWRTEDFRVEDSGFAFITMKNGATVILEASWMLNIAEGNDMKTTLCGTKAGVDMFDEGGGVRMNMIRHGKQVILRPDLKPVIFPGIPRALDHVQTEARFWVDCIRKDTAPPVDPEDAFAVTQIIEGIYRSARTGEIVVF